MTTSTRYYLDDNLNARNIVDSMTGKVVSDEPFGLSVGETGSDREARLDAQKTECTRLNAEDYATRRQFGEPRTTFIDRLTQAIESAGFSVSGPTDVRAAENGEPAWVCNARAAIAEASAA